MDEIDLYYPIERLISSPFMLGYLAKTLNNTPPDIIAEGFYSILEESVVREEEPGYLVGFHLDPEGAIQLSLQSGLTLFIERGVPPQFNSAEEVGASFELYSWLVNTLKPYVPEDWKEAGFGISDVPLPKNNFLFGGSEGDRFEGRIHKLGELDNELSFIIEVKDPEGTQCVVEIRKV